jgi:hypothetical protein
MTIKDEIARIAAVAGQKFMTNDFPNLQPEVKGCMRGVTFLWGHVLEVVNTLQTYSNNPDLRTAKYPLIALFTDIPVFKNKYGDFDGTLLHIVIANSTMPAYDSPRREGINFIPILRPLYGYFIAELKKSSVFSILNPMTDLKHEYYERFYWGKEGLYGNTGNIFNDYIDAIEIRNLDLRLNTPC